MKSYKIVLAGSAFETLPASIQTNQEAIEFVAEKFGIKIPAAGKVNQHKLKKDLRKQGVEAITCDNVIIFPHGKAITIEAPKPHDVMALKLRKKDVSVRAPRAKARQFVNSETFVGGGSLALAAS